MIRLHYCPIRNFGDALSPILVEKLSGDKVRFSAHPYVADLVATGSVLFSGSSLFYDCRQLTKPKGLQRFSLKLIDLFRKPVNIWGSGLLYESVPERTFIYRRANVCAVRGRRTLDVLRRVGFDCDQTVLGDPGLLYPLLLEKAPEKKFDVGIIPHYSDVESGRMFYNAMSRTGVTVRLIDVMGADPISVIMEIATCNKVISSSLHGLIVADAFGIPNRHIVFSTLDKNTTDFNFKFDDYYSSWNKKTPMSIDGALAMNDPREVLDEIRSIDCMPRPIYEKMKTDLISAFPYKSRKEI